MSHFIEQEPRRYLIAIGSPSAGDVQVPRLENVESDIDRIVNIFTKLEQGYERVLADRIELGAMTSEIQDALTSWFGNAKRQSSDCVIVYYAGHGGEDTHLGSHYLYTNGSRPNNLQRTAIETGSLVKWFFGGQNNYPQNVLLILDVCYAGQGGTELIQNLTKTNSTNLGKGFWVLGSANANTEASDGGFVDALESVMNNRQWQNGEEFLNPSVLTEEINKYFQSKNHPQQAVVSTLNNQNTATFVRNPSIDSNNLNLVSSPLLNNAIVVATSKRKIDLFVDRKSTDRFIKDVLNAILEPEAQPLMFYICGIGGIGKSTSLQKIQQACCQQTRFLKFTFGDPQTSSSIDTPIKLMKYLYRQLISENISVDPFWNLYHEYEQILQRLKTEPIEQNNIVSEEQLNSIKEYAIDAIKTNNSLISVNKILSRNESGLPSISPRDKMERLLNQHPATKNSSHLQDLFLEPLSKISCAFTQGLSKESQNSPIIILLDRYEKASPKFDVFVGCHLLLDELLGSSSVRIVMAGRFSLTNPRYKEIFRKDESILSEYSLDKFNEKETYSYLSEIGIKKTNQFRNIWQRTKGYPYYLNLIKKQIDKNSPVNLDVNGRQMVDLLIADLNEIEKAIIYLAAYCRWFDRPLINHLIYLFLQDIKPSNNSVVDWFRWLIERDFIIEGESYYQLDDVARDIIRRQQCKDDEQKFRLIHNAIAEYFEKLAKEEVQLAHSITERYANDDWQRFTTEFIYHTLFANRDRGQQQFLISFFEGACLNQPQIAIDVFQAVSLEAESESNALLPRNTQRLLSGRDLIYLSIMLGWQVVFQDFYKFELEVTNLVDKNNNSAKIDITNKIEAGLIILFKEIDRLSPLSRFVAFAGKGLRDKSGSISNLKQAQEEVEKIVGSEDSKFSSRLFIQLGRVWGQKGLHQEALESFDRSIQLHSDNAEAYMLRGVALVNLTHYEKSLISLHKAIQLKPDLPQSHRLIGQVLIQLGQYEKSLINLEKAIQLNPNDDEAHRLMGVTLVKLGHYKKSLVSFDKVIQLNPDDDETYILRGISFIYLGKYEEALVDSDTAIKLNLDHSQYHSLRGVALVKLDRYQEAITSLDKAIQFESNDSQSHKFKGISLFYLSHYQEALISIDKSIDLNPDDIESHTFKGHILLNLERYQEAINSSNKAIEISPNNVQASALKGNVLFSLTQYKEAINSCNEAISIQSSDSNAWNVKALCLSLIFDYLQAVAAIDRAIELEDNENKSNFIANKGIILARSSKYAEALECCETSINMNPSSEFGYYGKACCYALQGDNELAIKFFQQAVSRDPSRCCREARTNPDFDKLRNDERFIAIMEKGKYTVDKNLVI
jgi:tetratricopeptide (TPR) repeat protein